MDHNQYSLEKKNSISKATIFFALLFIVSIAAAYFFFTDKKPNELTLKENQIITDSNQNNKQNIALKDENGTPTSLTKFSETQNNKSKTNKSKIDTESKSGSGSQSGINSKSSAGSNKLDNIVFDSPGPVPNLGKKEEFREDFNTLNPNTWTASNYDDIRQANGKEHQCYMKKNVEVKNGMIILTARKQSINCLYTGKGKPKDYTSGAVYSNNLSIKPGQAVEIRSKLMPANSNDPRGLSAFIRTLNSNSMISSDGEIIFLYHRPSSSSKFNSGLRFLNTGGIGVDTYHYISNEEAVGMVGDWHTTRFEYGQNGNLKWFVDGKEMQGTEPSKYKTLQGWPAPFNNEIKNITIQLAVDSSGLNYQQKNDGNGIAYEGAKFAVDYVRIYNLE